MDRTMEADAPLGARAVQALRLLVARYGAGEAEVARAYFERTRTPAHDQVWLTAQVGRELSRVYQLSAAAEQELASFGNGGDRRRYAETVQKLGEELAHFNLLGDILEEVSGAPLDYPTLHRYDFFEPDPTAPFNGENARLAEVNRAINAEMAALQPPWAVLVQDQGLLEGGGNGLFYVGSQLQGGHLDTRLASAMRQVLADEMDHGPRSLELVPHCVQDEDALAAIIAYTRRRGDQRLRWRNEQFGYPLTPGRLDAIMAGDIEPLPIYAVALDA